MAHFYQFDDRIYRRLRDVRDSINLRYSVREQMRFFSYDNYEYCYCVDSQGYINSSWPVYHVYFCPRRRKIVISCY